MESICQVHIKEPCYIFCLKLFNDKSSKQDVHCKQNHDAGINFVVGPLEEWLKSLFGKV